MVRLAACALVLFLASGCRNGCGERGRSAAAQVDGQTDRLERRRGPLEPNRKVVDPYCGMEMRRGEAAATAVFRGKTYYFCLEDHRDAFNRDPERFLPAATTAEASPTPPSVTDDGGSAGSPDSQK